MQTTTSITFDSEIQKAIKEAVVNLVDQVSAEKENAKSYPEFMTQTQTQDFLNVSYGFLQKLVKQGLPVHRVGGRKIFNKSEITDWIIKH